VSERLKPTGPHTPPFQRHTLWSVIVLLTAILFGLAVVVGMSGCASSDRGERHLTRTERKQTHILIPATADAPAQIVPVVEITEIREGETTEHTGTNSPDWQQIQPMVWTTG
jgi:hypothetical protein